MVLNVSGNVRTIISSQVPEQATKNQNMERQPKLAFRAEAITGPTLGAVFVLNHDFSGTKVASNFC